ncbi:MAG: tetratricopeptide repeat protein, partial [Rhabdochlamydiaceae bacterium]
MKLVKCKALLSEVQGKSMTPENAKSLLQECEALQTSIIDPICHRDKQEFQLELVKYYASQDLDKACQIAEKLPSSSDLLFKAAQCIQKAGSTSEQVKPLFEQAFNAHVQEIGLYLQSKNDVVDIIQLSFTRTLEFAEIFSSLCSDELKAKSLGQAKELAYKFGDPLNRHMAFWRIVACCHKMRDDAQKDIVFFIYKTKDALIEITEDIIEYSAPDSSIDAYLELADICFLVEDYREMKKWLGLAKSKIDKNALVDRIKYFGRWVKLEKKFSANKKTGHKLNTPSVEYVIKENLELIPMRRDLSTKDRAEAYLNIANAYQELGKMDDAEEAIGEAFKQAQTLPASTDQETASKIELLDLICINCYWNRVSIHAKSVMSALEGLYDQFPPTNLSDSSWSKERLGSFILYFYNEMKYFAEAKIFLDKYLLDFQKEPATHRIGRLMTAAEFNLFNKVINEERCDQLKTLLETAENLLPQVASVHYKDVVSRLAKG